MFKAGHLTGTDWRRLLAYSDEEVVRVIIPEVVLRETIRHFKRAVSKASKDGIDSFVAAQNVFRPLGVNLQDSVNGLRKAVREEAAAYEPWLRKELADHDVVIAPLPKIEHERLLSWAMEERQPFKDTGEGYRDALIWATILEITEQYDSLDQVWFVSDNVKDFHGHPGALAAPLVRDLAGQANCPSVEIHRTLSDLFKSKADHLIRLETAIELQNRLTLSPSAFDLVGDAVESACDELVGEDLPDEEWAISGHSYVESPTFYSVSPDLSTLDWQIVEEFEGGTLVGTATVRAEVSVDGYASKSDAYLETGEIVILDGDYNDHSSWVATTVSADLEFNLTLTPDAESVENVEYIGITLVQD